MFRSSFTCWDIWYILWYVDFCRLVLKDTETRGRLISGPICSGSIFTRIAKNVATDWAAGGVAWCDRVVSGSTSFAGACMAVHECWQCCSSLCPYNQAFRIPIPVIGQSTLWEEGVTVGLLYHVALRVWQMLYIILYQIRKFYM